MKKFIIIIAILAVAGWAGGTYYSSLQSERYFNTQMEKTREMYGSMLQASLDEYHRGFLESEAKTSVQMGDFINLHLQHHIRHLPWGAKIVTGIDRGAYPPEELAEIEKYLALDEVRLVSRVFLTGSSQVRMEVPDIDVQEDGDQFQVSGLELNGTLNAAMDAGDYDIRLARLQGRSAKGESVELESLRYSGSFRYEDALPVGKGSLTLDGVRAAEQDEVMFDLGNLILRVDTTLKDNKMNQHADLTFDTLSVTGEAFSDGRLKYAITGLDADSMRDLQNVYRSLSADVMASREPDPFLLQMQIAGKFWQMLQKGMHFELETLELTSPNGAVNLQGVMDLAEADPQSMLGFDMKKVRAEATLQMDESALLYGYRLATAKHNQHLPEEELAKQADAFEQSLLAQNILVKGEAGGLKAEFSFADGQGKLNGNLLPR